MQRRCTAARRRLRVGVALLQERARGVRRVVLRGDVQRRPTLFLTSLNVCSTLVCQHSNDIGLVLLRRQVQRGPPAAIGFIRVDAAFRHQHSNDVHRPVQRRHVQRRQTILRDSPRHRPSRLDVIRDEISSQRRRQFPGGVDFGTLDIRLRIRAHGDARRRRPSRIVHRRHITRIPFVHARRRRASTCDARNYITFSTNYIHLRPRRRRRRRAVLNTLHSRSRLRETSRDDDDAPKMCAHRRPRRPLGDPSRVLLARARLSALWLPNTARYATSASTETSTTPANGETSPAIAGVGARTNAAVAIEAAVARASVAIVVVVVVVSTARARHRAIARASTRRLETHRPRPRTARAGATVDDGIGGDVGGGIGGGVGGGGDARRRASRGDGDRPNDRTNDRTTDRPMDFGDFCAPPIFQNVRVVSVYKDSKVSIVVFETHSCGVPPRTSRDRSEEKEPTLSTRIDPSRRAGRGRRRDGDEKRARLGEARHIDASE